MSLFEFSSFLKTEESEQVLANFNHLSQRQLYNLVKATDHTFKFKYFGFTIFPHGANKLPGLHRYMASRQAEGFRIFLSRLRRTLSAHSQILGRVTGTGGRFKIVTATATKFVRGQYIEPHSDGVQNDFAYVYYPAKTWSRRGGGDLVFIDQNSEQARFSPLGNRLILFSVPRMHYVEPIRIKQDRLAISGWVRMLGKKHGQAH